MKIKSFFLLGLLILCSGCRGRRLVLVPEISQPLIQEEVFSWSGQVAGNRLFPCAGGIGWVDASGKIVSWNVEKKAAGAVAKLPFPITDPPFCQGDFLVLKNPTTDHLLVFDLTDLKMEFELRDLKLKQILAVDRDCLVYLEDKSLVVYSWQNPAGIFRMKTAEEKFFNCHFFPDRVLILSSEHLHVFWKKKGAFEQIPLPLPAVSAFFCQENDIYYGSARRQLVKFSLLENKVVWKLKLGQNLQRPPFAFNGTVVINPADNNVLQVNKRGSVRWWLALQSTLQFNLLPMTDNLAAFLMSREIKFINLRQKQTSVFKMEGSPVDMPLRHGGDLYFLLADADGKTKKLQRVGNLYGLELALAPTTAKWSGQFIVFSLVTYNLLKPRLSCVISDSAGNTVLNKDLGMVDQATLAWIPAQPGNFKIKVAAAALNRNAGKEVSFRVFDRRIILPEFFWHF